MPENVLYLTELQGLPVYDLRRKRIGRVKDAAVVPLIDPARIDRFLVGGELAWLTIRYDQIRSVSLDGIMLLDERLTPYHSDEYLLRVVRDLLDQQIIDAQGRKVVRVTDLTFEVRAENGFETLRVLEVDIGLRSIFRRVFQGAPRKLIRRLQEWIPPRSIPWEFCNIIEPDPQRRLRLNVSNQLLEKMHPADLADIIEELSPEDREAIFESIDSEVAAETLSEIDDPKIQANLVEALEVERAAEIIEEMSPDEAADLLAELEERNSEEILDELDALPQGEVRDLLEFEEDTAGGMMNTEFVKLHERANAADAWEAIKAHEDLLDELNTIFLIDEDEKLKAAIPTGKLFAARGETPLIELAAETLIHATVDEHQDIITGRFDKYNLLTMPVVDAEGRLVGVITADDVISVLRRGS